jgi:twitching motility protein PilT
MMNTKEILAQITQEKASDIFIVAGRPLTYKVNGNMKTYSDERMMPDMCKEFVLDIYALAGNRDMTLFEETGDDGNLKVKNGYLKRT